MDRIIGFSTGVLFNEPMDMIEKIEIIRNVGCNAVELAYLKVYHLFDGADRLSAATNILKDFKYVSLHAPTYEYGDNPGTQKIFDIIQQINSWRKLDLVIVHPHEVLDFSVFKDAGFKVGFENMDRKRKSFGKAYLEPKDLIGLFSKHSQYSFILDVAHIFCVDPTLTAAVGFFELTNQVAEIHLSGYNVHHAPLSQTKQIELIKLASQFAKLDTPIIIESTPPLGMMEEELDYILRHL